MSKIRTLSRALALLLVAALFTVPAWGQDASQLVHTGPLPPGTPGAPGVCNGFAEYQQPLDPLNFGTARTSDEEAMFVTSEAILSGGVITPLTERMADNIRFWGISAIFNGGFLGECSDDDDVNTPFVVTFSDDNAGTPGNVIASAVVAPTSITDTTIPFAFATIHEYDIALPPMDVTGAAWVSVQRQTGASNVSGQCLFLWVDETDLTTYDNVADQNGGSVPSDHIFCLSAPVAIDGELPIPTLGTWGLLLLLLGLGVAGVFFLRR